jgi:hypothetical protein
MDETKRRQCDYKCVIQPHAEKRVRSMSLHCHAFENNACALWRYSVAGLLAYVRVARTGLRGSVRGKREANTREPFTRFCQGAARMHACNGRHNRQAKAMMLLFTLAAAR